MIVAAAYLVSRGGLLPRLFSRHSSRDLLTLAAVFALLGASEIVFPNDRYPYVPYTLAAAFAGYAGGVTLGLLTALGITIAGAAALAVGVAVPTPWASWLSVMAAGGIGGIMARVWRAPSQEKTLPSMPVLLLGGFLAGALGETAHVVISLLLHRPISPPAGWLTPAVYSVASDGFGCVLLAVVLFDAYERRIAQERRVLAEQEAAALRLSQMGEMQARLHPHFLFNALAGIAGLCVTNPAGAERGVTDLAALLRRFLRTPSEAFIPLKEELETVRAYLAIEYLRLEDRLRVTEELSAETLALPVPRFCLQVPVENAVQHGVAAAGRRCCVRIVARLYRRHLLLVVYDDGVGAASYRVQPAPMPEAPHGLALLAGRLQLAYGPAARLRLCGKPQRGTLCVLRLPRTGIQ